MIAYKVPWNTCAIWNYQLFIKFVGKIDEITYKNPFSSICVCIDDICCETPHKGMEDGLAIAKAVSNRKRKLYFKLIKEDALFWTVNNVQDHREKLARKDKVLRDFMVVKGFKEGDLLAADLG